MLAGQAHHHGSPLPGGMLAAAAPVASPRLGAFVRRGIVVAPPRVSVRPTAAVAGGGPPVPASARTGPVKAPAPTQAEADVPVIRRSLSGAAHSLFRSLLRSSAPGAPDSPVLAEGNGMFDNAQPPEPAVIRRFHNPGQELDEHLDGHPSAPDELSPAMRARDFDELIDRIVAKLERRVLDDLERRGRRGIPGVF